MCAMHTERITMQLYDELVARGLIAQVTDEDEIKELINNGKARTQKEPWRNVRNVYRCRLRHRCRRIL